MASRFDATYLSASPCYPDAIAWSDENLLAVASGHVVTIMNPSSLSGPRGWITLRSRLPVQIGVVKKQDLLAPCLLSTCLARDVRPCVRSLSWSHQGLAPNSGCGRKTFYREDTHRWNEHSWQRHRVVVIVGHKFCVVTKNHRISVLGNLKCLLAVCTIDGCVKLYRAPFCDFRAEWVEVMDISHKLYGYYLSTDFGDILSGSIEYFHKQKAEGHYATVLSTSAARDKGLGLRAAKKSRVKADLRAVGSSSIIDINENHDDDDDGHSDDNAVSNCIQHSKCSVTVHMELVLIPNLFSKGTSVEVLKHKSSQKFWINGKIVRIEEEKALVHFAEAIEDEQYDAWFSLNLEPDKRKEGASSPNMRPLLDLGKLPNEICLSEHNEEVTEVLTKGQAVEAWVNNRWVDGEFLGLDDGQLLIDLHGDYGCIRLMPENVRLMPLWVPDHNSWQITVVKIKKITEVPVVKSVTIRGRKMRQDTHKEGSRNRDKGNAFLSFFISEQYAFRSNLLASLVVSWSPILHLSTNLGTVAISGSSKTCALLAVGGKSGKISFWRLNEPKCYAVDQCPVSTDTMLVGLLQAHISWVTAISWVVRESASEFLLATGSCDGCVKLWLGDIEGVVISKEVKDDCLCLLREVVVTGVPVSVLSCTVPSKSPNEILLAIGRGSGSLEVLSCDISRGGIIFNRQFDAHDQVVTGISWAFDGRCLYSCSQDNSVRCWILQADSLCPAPFPLSSPTFAYDNKRTSSEIPRHIFDSCFGLALSPGNLVLAVVHSVDTALVDPMYESRAQRAALELIWTGGMIKVSLVKLPDQYVDGIPGFSDKDLVCWQSSILWSLEQYAHPEKPVILWDIMEALLAFKQVAPNYVETILYNWLSGWWPDPDALISLEKVLSSAHSVLCKIDSRHIHLINIVCRRLVLPEMKNMTHSGKDEQYPVDHEVLKLWMNLLINSETELQKRLVSLTFSAVLYLASGNASALPLDRPCWFPTGVAQMQQWAVMNNDMISDDLKLLKLEVDKLQKRIYSVCEYVPEEWCNFCSSSVPFESPEVAFCDGSGCSPAGQEKHKLLRCATSMQVCDASPLWFCMCCRRYVYKLAPSTLFTGHASQYFSCVTEPSFLQTYSRPFCPFCGILLQRLQPEFLLSTCLI